MIARAVRVLVIAVSCAVALTSDATFAAPSSFVRVLSDDDVANYKKLFAAAAAGDKDQMAALSPLIQNRSLMGHVTAKGYLSPSTVAVFDDLKAWMKKYDDYPEASRIYALAVRKDPKRAGELEDPDKRIVRGYSDEGEGPADFTSPVAEAAAKKLRGLSKRR